MPESKTYNIDCMEYIAWLPDNEFDLAVVDPPYGIGEDGGIAAYDMGFDFVGIELDADYFQDQEKRFSDHIAQGELFKSECIQENIFQEELF